MNAFDPQTIADEERRRQLLNAAAILMDVLGYSVRDALVMRGKLTGPQLGLLERAFLLPEPQRRSTVERIVREANRPKPARPRRRGRPMSICKSDPDAGQSDR